MTRHRLLVIVWRLEPIARFLLELYRLPVKWFVLAVLPMIVKGH